MTQREKYNIEFATYDSPMSGKLTPYVSGLMDTDNLLYGREAHYLSSIINYYALYSMSEVLITDINEDIRLNSDLHEAYANGDDADYIATHKGYLIVGNEDSHMHPANCKIPLTDFRDLLLEWRDFLKQNGISRT